MLALDLADDKVRRRVERTLKGLGFRATQYSLRIGWLTPGELRRLKQALNHLLTGEHHVALIPLVQGREGAQTWGQPLGMGQIRLEEGLKHDSGWIVEYPPERRAHHAIA